MADVNNNEREHKIREDHPDIISSADDSSVREDSISSGGDVAVRVSVLKSIEEAYEKVHPLPSDCSIYRVPKPQLERKPEAYIPCMFSIGPFHHDKEHLKPMEADKLRYLNDFLTRRKSVATLENYVDVVTESEDRARQCYSEIIEESKEKFVKMMVIDGCFILELILKTVIYALGDHDPIMKATWKVNIIMSDLLLLENQLPLFVLQSLYKLFREKSDSNYGRLDTYITNFLKYHIDSPQPQCVTPGTSRFQHISAAVKNVFDHIRDIVTPRRRPDQVGVPNQLQPETPEPEEEENSDEKHLLSFLRYLFLQSSSGWMPEKRPHAYMSIHCATRLHEASVKFEVETKNTCLLDITFRNGVLKIPTITTQDGTESILRNLIAFEQSSSAHKNFITDYASFIDDLINSPNDVELLEKNGIIENLLGEPKDVADLFNGLLKGVTIGSDNFSSVRRDLNKYYETPWNNRMASLKHNYFNNPWASIACLAAFILFVLTVAQTVCSILSLTSS